MPTEIEPTTGIVFDIIWPQTEWSDEFFCRTVAEKAARTLAALDSPIGEQGVGVKALTWRCVGNGIWEAGHHQVWHQWASDGLWYSSVNVGHRKIERIGDGFKSLEEAQSACQADFNRRIRAALSPERKEPGWRAMDSARKDGTMVDLWCRAPGLSAGPGRVTDCWFSAGKWWRYDEHGDDQCRSRVHNITHWRPLPATPEQPT